MSREAVGPLAVPTILHAFYRHPLATTATAIQQDALVAPHSGANMGGKQEGSVGTSCRLAPPHHYAAAASEAGGPGKPGLYLHHATTSPQPRIETPEKVSQLCVRQVTSS